MRITEGQLRQIIREERKKLLREGFESVGEEIMQILRSEFARIDGNKRSYPFGRHRGDEREYMTFARKDGGPIGQEICNLIEEYMSLVSMDSFAALVGVYRFKNCNPMSNTLEVEWYKHTSA